MKRVFTAVLGSSLLLGGWSVFAQEQPSSQDVAELRLGTMKAAVKAYRFRGADQAPGEYTATSDPLLRFTNPVSGLQAGGFFVWSDSRGRPMAAAQIFLTAENLWLHEFQSLSPSTFTATLDGQSTWAPRKPGVQVRLMPNAPLPAETAVKRLVQMRDLAKRFSASDDFEGRTRADELRLLTKPLARFGAEGTSLQDGALFTLAHGTDPELLILIEALRTDGEYRWHYSLAPMTGYALRAQLDGEQVWEVGWRKPPYAAQDPFFLRVAGRETRTP